MDRIDRSILLLLQENARMTASQLGQEINMSVSAVSERIKKLENSGIIKQYTTIIDSEHTNKRLTALMEIALEAPKYLDTFRDYVMHEDEILDCHYITGDFDYMLKIVTTDTHSLEDLLNRIKAIKGIAKTKTTVALSTVKNVHSVLPEISEN